MKDLKKENKKKFEFKFFGGFFLQKIASLSSEKIRRTENSVYWGKLTYLCKGQL